MNQFIPRPAHIKAHNSNFGFCEKIVEKNVTLHDVEKLNMDLEMKAFCCNVLGCVVLILQHACKTDFSFKIIFQGMMHC